MINNQEWREVKGYEGLYWVNALGQVKGQKHIKHPTPSKHGHSYVDLYKNNVRKKALVHRLVAKEFIPNPNNYPNVCHKDDNPRNNHIDNLFWGTQKMNVQDMVNKGRNRNKVFQGEKNGTAKLKDADIPTIRQLLQSLNCVEIAKIYKVDRTAISLIKRGRTWTHV